MSDLSSLVIEPQPAEEDAELLAAIRPLALLVDGLDALERGRSSHAKLRFEQTIRESGAVASLEVGHAWRGMAERAIHAGEIADAEAYLRRAVSVFREVARAHPTMQQRAKEAEGLVLLAGGELLMLRGLFDTANSLLYRAERVLVRLGDERTAEAWAASGRLARHRGEHAAALEAFGVAESAYERTQNHGGRAEVLLEIALVRRVEDPSAALRMLDLAATMARDAGRAELLARVHLGRGQILHNEAAAQQAYQSALARARQSGARAAAGFALLGLGSRGWPGAERHLLAAAQVLLDAAHYPGFGLALVRIAQHGLRVGDVELAMAAAEGAWRVYRGVDPVLGLSRVLGLAVRCFVAQRLAWPTLLAACARAGLDESPQVHEIRDVMVGRAPQAWLERLRRMTEDAQLAEVRAGLQGQIVPALRRLGLLPSSFATAQGALDVVGMLAGVSPRAAARQLAPPPEEEVVESLPEPRMPDLGDLHFGKRAAVRLVAGGTKVRTEVPRTKVYDPDGRIADAVFGSLDFVRDTEGVAVPDSAFSAFPSDAGMASWIAPETVAAEGEAPPVRSPPPVRAAEPDPWDELERAGFADGESGASLWSGVLEDDIDTEDVALPRGTIGPAAGMTSSARVELSDGAGGRRRGMFGAERGARSERRDGR